MLLNVYIVGFNINYYKVLCWRIIMAKDYNKLVRDRIPEIIKNNGEFPIVHEASNSEYEIKLKEKLLEEVNEYLQSEKIEELADLLEVIYAICDNNNLSVEELEKIRRNKAEKRGKFLDKIILEKVEWL